MCKKDSMDHLESNVFDYNENNENINTLNNNNDEQYLDFTNCSSANYQIN